MRHIEREVRSLTGRPKESCPNCSSDNMVRVIYMNGRKGKCNDCGSFWNFHSPNSMLFKPSMFKRGYR